MARISNRYDPFALICHMQLIGPAAKKKKPKVGQKVMKNKTSTGAGEVLNDNGIIFASLRRL